MEGVALEEEQASCGKVAPTNNSLHLSRQKTSRSYTTDASTRDTPRPFHLETLRQPYAEFFIYDHITKPFDDGSDFC